MGKIQSDSVMDHGFNGDVNGKQTPIEDSVKTFNTKLITTAKPSGREIVEGEIITACAISAADIYRDIKEHIRNFVGGRMRDHEKIMQDTIDRALHELDEEAKRKGYDGVVAIKIAHPDFVAGGVEIVVYGTAFNYR